MLCSCEVLDPLTQETENHSPHFLPSQSQSSSSSPLHHAGFLSPGVSSQNKSRCHCPSRCPQWVESTSSSVTDSYTTLCTTRPIFLQQWAKIMVKDTLAQNLLSCNHRKSGNRRWSEACDTVPLNLENCSPELLSLLWLSIQLLDYIYLLCIRNTCMIEIFKTRLLSSHAHQKIFLVVVDFPCCVVIHKHEV